MFGAVGFLGTTAVVLLTLKGNARLGALAFLATLVVMVGYALLDSGVIG